MWSSGTEMASLNVIHQHVTDHVSTAWAAGGLQCYEKVFFFLSFFFFFFMMLTCIRLHDTDEGEVLSYIAPQPSAGPASFIPQC